MLLCVCMCIYGVYLSCLFIQFADFEIYAYVAQDGPDILVCDEAHMIKNTRADVTQTLKQVKCQRRIALTGSPLQNNLMEYYCVRFCPSSDVLYLTNHQSFELFFMQLKFFNILIVIKFYHGQMVDFVREGFLGSSHEFRNRYGISYIDDDYSVRDIPLICTTVKALIEEHS